MAHGIRPNHKTILHLLARWKQAKNDLLFHPGLQILFQNAYTRLQSALANINAIENFEIMVEAVEQHNHFVVSQLLSNGYDPYSIDEKKTYFPPHRAFLLHNLSMLELFMERGVLPSCDYRIYKNFINTSLNVNF